MQWAGHTTDPTVPGTPWTQGVNDAQGGSKTCLEVVFDRGLIMAVIVWRHYGALATHGGHVPVQPGPGPPWGPPEMAVCGLS